MTNATVTTAYGRETGPLRCWEIVRTERGWERCHLDQHDQDARHHVRDRSWLSAENTPRLRLGEPCGAACTWPAWSSLTTAGPAGRDEPRLNAGQRRADGLPTPPGRAGRIDARTSSRRFPG